MECARARDKAERLNDEDSAPVACRSRAETRRTRAMLAEQTPKADALAQYWANRRVTAMRVMSVRHPGSSCGRPNVLGVSCAAGPACRSRSGAAVAAHDVRRTESRTATAVTPPRWRHGRQLGCRAEARPHQLHTKVRRRRSQ